MKKDQITQYPRDHAQRQKTGRTYLHKSQYDMRVVLLAKGSVAGQEFPQLSTRGE